ncbi:hypothetical protein EDD18DRAFT_1112004 [Armillaria luteobubalina]|uniref:Uncharacterized protein n=1 Tax=Armillaria luteobubalina TaxID=153913 RepID=A0AA39UIL0_9AGAR|nr:hypothetical protein EDD18DRAFT_1112004 [Armillaria luteobubalina]
MNANHNVIASSGKRAQDTPYQDNDRSKVQKKDTDEETHKPCCSNRDPARPTTQGPFPGHHIFSHVELPTLPPQTKMAFKVIPSLVSHPSLPSPSLPGSYGPSIRTMSSFISRCNKQSRAAANGQCQVLSFFGIFCFQRMVICTLHRHALEVILLSLLECHLDRGHKFSVHQGKKDNSDTTVKRTRKDLLHDIVQHVSECCALPLIQSPQDFPPHLEVTEILFPPPSLSPETYRQTTKVEEPMKRQIKMEQSAEWALDWSTFIDITWTKQMNWDEYRAGLGLFSPGKLSELIASPALRLILTELGEHQAIELGLHKLKKVALAYLLQFHNMMTTIPEVRELVACKLISRYKIHSKLSYYKPCSVLVSTVALMMRYQFHLHKTPHKKLYWMGHFKLQCTPDQDIAAKTLYELFVNSGGSPSEQDIETSSPTAYTPLPIKIIKKSGDTEQSGDIDLDVGFPDEIPDGLELEDQSEDRNDLLQETQYTPQVESEVLQTIISFAAKHISLIDPKTSEGVTNPFNRLKTLSSSLYTSVQKAKHVIVTNVGHQIKVTYPDGTSTGVNLDKWQKHNAQWLDPLRQSIWTDMIRQLRLHNEGKVQVDLCQQWLEKEQTVLKALAVVFSLTCGIIPGQHQFQVLFDKIWSHYRHLTDSSYYWRGLEISEPVVKHTKEYLDEPLTPAEICHIMLPILKHYCASFIMQTMNSIVDKAAQHTALTSLNNYGHIGSLLGLGLMEENWATHMNVVGLRSPHALLGHNYLPYARAAIKAYGPLSDPELIKQIFTLRPFIQVHGQTGDRKYVFGDAILIEVTQSIIQDMQLWVLDSRTVTQCTTEEVVAAMSLIVRSLNKRITGSFVDLTALDIDSLLHYFRIQSHFTIVVDNFKEKHPDGWEMFVNKVLGAVS